LLRFGTGYSGINLFAEDSWGNPNFFYGDLFGPDRVGSMTNSGAPAGDYGVCRGSCPPYVYQHINEFVEEAEGYDTPKDPCWDWIDFTIEYNYDNVECASSIYNPAIQIPDPNNPSTTIPDPERLCECGYWNTKKSKYEIVCRDLTGNTDFWCPPQIYYPTSESGTNWCGGTVFDIFAPNITREFKRAFIDDGVVGRDPEDLKYGDYFYAGGLSIVPNIVFRERSKKDHRKAWRKSKVRVRFVVPPTCYFKVWAKVKITTLGCSENACFPDTVISENTYDLTPVEWIGDDQNCYAGAGYPYSGNTQTVDIINSLSERPDDLEFAFVDESGGEKVGEITAPETPLGVTCGHAKTMLITFKHSMIPDYEPEWGCRQGSREQPAGSGEYVEACNLYDIWDQGGNPPPLGLCIDTDALPTPLCHDV
jgi:hypothetical protein